MNIIKNNCFFNFDKLSELVSSSFSFIAGKTNLSIWTKEYKTHLEVVVIYNFQVYGFLIFEYIDNYFRLTRFSFKDEKLEAYYEKRILIRIDKNENIKERTSWTL